MAAGVLFAQAAGAHDRGAAPASLGDAWSPTPWSALAIATMFAIYALGLVRLWRRAGFGRGVRPIEALAFVAGLAALFLAMAWPLDAYGEWSLAAHMAQHMILLALAPPLLLAGQPLALIAPMLPRAPMQWANRFAHRRLIAGLGAATLAHGAAMALWHLPAATAAALAHEGVHVLMHASFFAAGLWFWAALLRASGAGVAAVAIVAVMMLMGAIGALLVFSRRVLYGAYAERSTALGLDPLTDQQLAGLIMWVPAMLPYLLGGLWLLWRSLTHMARRERYLQRAAP